MDTTKKTYNYIETSTPTARLPIKSAVRIIAIFIAVILLYSPTQANPISPNQARRVAYRFMTIKKMLPSGLNPEILVDYTSKLKTENLYVFAPPTGIGFVILAADDCVEPILGYSTSTQFSYDPVNLQELLNNYSNDIAYAVGKRISASDSTQILWRQMLDEHALEPTRFETAGNSSSNDMSDAIGPLLPVQWNQSPYYNDSCPYDATAQTHVVTGCVATALAQVLRYWGKPTTGNRSHSYVHNIYGRQYANFGATTYHWNHMPAQIDGNSSAEQIQAVAQLMYHCGVAVEMGYGVGGSTSYLASYGDTNFASQEMAYKKYFGYKQDIHPLDYNNFTVSQWIDSLKYELNMARVVPYCGFGSSGGHAYLIDGYDVHNMFHVNWGWGGLSDGFFLIDVLPSYGESCTMLAGVEPIGSLHSTATTTTSYGEEGGSSSFRIFTNEESSDPWHASTDATWIHLSPASGVGPIDTLTIIVDSNDTDQNRSAMIIITQGTDTIYTSVAQYGYHGIDQIRPENDTIRMEYANNGAEITDTLYPGTHYVIYSPIDSTTGHYPEPANCRLHLVSAGGVIVGSTTCDIEEGTDYLNFIDADNEGESWKTLCTLTGHVADSGFVAESRHLYIRFHADGYNPGSGYEIDLYVCDTFEAQCRNIVIAPTGPKSVRVLWVDTSEANQWKVYYGTDPKNLTSFVYTTQQQVDLGGIDYSHNNYFYRIYNNSGSTEADGPCASLLGSSGSKMCPGSSPIVNVEHSNITMHTADIRWDDLSHADTLLWHIHYGTDFWGLDTDYISTPEFDSTHYTLTGLDNDRAYFYRIFNNGMANDSAMGCYLPPIEEFTTPRCQWDSLDVRDVTFNNITGTSCQLSWSDYGAASQWEIVVFNELNISDTIWSNTPYYTLTGLLPGKYYEVALYNNTGLTDTTGCELRHGFSTPCDISNSQGIDYTNFYDCMVIPHTGYYEEPRAWLGAVDYGSDNGDSRQTVHRDTNEYDPRTGNQLRCIPEGDTASVRLGNWGAQGQAESLTYIYDVDTTTYDLLLLKYAAVLEDPGHDPSEQPRFTFRIKDSLGLEIFPECYSADFIADSSLGWNTYGHILWKDWTYVGVDLTPFHGQRIYIELTTYDCSQGTHFGYAYFILSLDNKNIESEQCGSAFENDLIAPRGFNYAWYDRSNDSLVSTERIYTCHGAGDYYCRLSFVGTQSDSCWFSISARSAYRFPAANFSYRLADTIDCTQQVVFSDSSFVSRNTELTDLTSTPCEGVIWYFDTDTVGITDSIVTKEYGIGEYDITLVAYLGGGMCTDTITKHLIIEPTCDTYDTTYLDFCHGDTITFYDTIILDQGTYTITNGWYHHVLVLNDRSTYSIVKDTIVENQLPYNFNGQVFYNTVDSTCVVLSRQNYYGCDSSIYYSLHVYYNTHADFDTTICPESLPYHFENLTLDNTGIDTLIIPNAHGADSIVTILLKVDRSLQAEMKITPAHINYQNYDKIQLSDISQNAIARTWYLPDMTETRERWEYRYPLGNDSVEVMLVAQSDLGCLDTAIDHIVFTEQSIFYPNTFTPSGDQNNLFRFMGQNIAQFHAYIYNRQGDLVAEFNSIDEYWDGTHHGTPCPQAAYVWTIKYSTIHTPSSFQIQTGTVTLLR